MIGNVIQSLYLTQSDYPSAAALSFVLMALIMVVVVDLHPLRRLGGADGGGGAMNDGTRRLEHGCASTRSTSSAAWSSSTC